MVIIIAVPILYYNYWGYTIMDKDERQSFVEKIKNTPILPDKFYDIYNSLYTDALNKNYWQYMFSLDKRFQCPCREAVFIGVYPQYTGFDLNLIIPTIEKNVSQKECLNFYLSEFDFTDGNIGVQNTARYYFDKDLEELNDSEIIELYIRMENPSRYRSEKNSRILEEKVYEQLNKK